MIEQWTIGKIRITKIEELVEVIEGASMIPEALPEKVKAHPWLYPDYADANGNIIFSVHSFIVEHNDLTIVVDTCLGHEKRSSIARWDKITTQYLADFKSAGFNPEQVDFVLCTHLHEDHVGWNTIKIDGRWMPTFANAKYLFSETEWQHWTESEYVETILKSSIAPLIENNLHQLITPPHQLTEGISLIPTPGHTPGHISIALESEGQKAVITGDIMHSPVQCAEPKWRGASDIDPQTATQTRLAFLKQHQNQDTLILGTHFPTPSGGKIKSSGKAWIFDSKKDKP